MVEKEAEAGVSELVAVALQIVAAKLVDHDHHNQLGMAVVSGGEAGDRQAVTAVRHANRKRSSRRQHLGDDLIAKVVYTAESIRQNYFVRDSLYGVLRFSRCPSYIRRSGGHWIQWRKMACFSCDRNCDRILALFRCWLGQILAISRNRLRPAVSLTAASIWSRTVGRVAGDCHTPWFNCQTASRMDERYVLNSGATLDFKPDHVPIPVWAEKVAGHCRACRAGRTTRPSEFLYGIDSTDSARRPPMPQYDSTCRIATRVFSLLYLKSLAPANSRPIDH